MVPSPQASFDRFDEALPDEDFFLEFPHMVIFSSEDENDMSSEEEGGVEVLSFNALFDNQSSNDNFDNSSASDGNYEFDYFNSGFFGESQIEEHNHSSSEFAQPNMEDLFNVGSDVEVYYPDVEEYYPDVEECYLDETVEPSFPEENSETATSEPGLLVEGTEVPEPVYCFFIKDLLDAEEFSGGFFIRRLNMLCDSFIRFLGTITDVSFRNDHKIVVYTVQDDLGAIECYGEPQDLLERITIENKIEELKKSPETVTSQMQIVKLTSSLALLNKKDHHFLPGDMIDVIGNLRVYNHKCVFIHHAEKVNNIQYKINFLDNLLWLYEEIYPNIQYMRNLHENIEIGEDEESKEEEQDIETGEIQENLEGCGYPEEMEEGSEEQGDTLILKENQEMREKETSKESGEIEEGEESSEEVEIKQAEVFFILQENQEFEKAETGSKEEGEDKQKEEEKAEGGGIDENAEGKEGYEYLEKVEENKGGQEVFFFLEGNKIFEKEETESEEEGEDKYKEEEKAEGGGINVNSERKEGYETLEEEEKVFFILAENEEMAFYHIVLANEHDDMAEK